VGIDKRAMINLRQNKGWLSGLFFSKKFQASGQICFCEPEKIGAMIF
jgi:hypothetical protein